MALHILLSIVTVFWLSIVYIGSGAFLLRLLRMDTLWNRATRGLVAFALGFGVVGNGIMILGFAGRLNTVSIVMLLAIVSVPAFFMLTRLKLRPLISDVRVQISLYYRQAPFLSTLSGLLLIGYWARSLLPPTGFDSLMYHLSTVKLYLQRGGFWDIYFNGQSDFPMFTQMHYAIGQALHNDIIAKGISFLVFAAAAALVVELTRTLTRDRKAHLLSLLIFMTLPVIIPNGSTCYVDISQALWTVLSIKLLIDMRTSGVGMNRLFVPAFIAGLSVQSKIFGIFTIPLLITALVVIRKRDIASRRGFAELLLLAGIPLVMVLPWYAKSIVYNGSILLRAGDSLYSVGQQSSVVVHFLELAVDFVKRTITAPWHYSLFPSQHRMNTVGPLFLMVLPFMLFLRSIPARVKLYLLMAAVYLFQITLMDSVVLQKGSSIRYTMSALFLMIAPTVWVLIRLKTHLPSTHRFIHSLVLITIILNACVFFKRYNREWLALLTMKTRHQYLRSVLPEYAVIEKINSLPDDGVIMPVYNFSQYLIEKEYITAYRQYSSNEEFLKDLKQKNIRYFFGNNTLRVEENSNPFPEITEKKLVFEKNGFTLYRLTY
ncbi:MAG: hypothetical protein ACOCW2_01540 [Chitinivibrionales bacterium]